MSSICLVCGQAWPGIPKSCPDCKGELMENIVHPQKPAFSKSCNHCGNGRKCVCDAGV